MGVLRGLVDILLGPEGTRLGGFFQYYMDMACRSESAREASCGVCAGFLTCGGGRCVLFENWTVDASIFNESKCLRAHGGCLGTRSR